MGETQIEQRCFPAGANVQIIRFDVAMNEPDRVQGSQGIGRLLGNKDTEFGAQPATPTQDVADGLANNPFHHHVDWADAFGPRPYNPNQVWVSNRHADAGFAAEQLDIGFVASCVVPENFNGPGTSLNPIDGRINIAGGTAAQSGSQDEAG
jgi:hypothetical protein